jgi:MarR family transcriptional regulator, lower aerobic nicotinate degradation pathway regulator
VTASDPPDVGPADPAEDLGIVDALAQLSFLVQGTLARHAGAHELSLVQMRMMGVLRDREPSMNQLASLLELDKSSVSGLIDRAAQRGLVARRPSEQDRRTIHVRLTARGRRLAGKVAREFEADVTKVTETLTEQERATLSTLVTRVIAHR